ncbi:MAG: LPXTG cell wall anchor domain-containing protein [Lachnospiraceae bacterium]|nr:LPXTG cell wall anchor domain-containing protein [Lachnospiraceae bacterium]
MMENKKVRKKNRLMIAIFALVLSLIVLAGATKTLASDVGTVDNSVDKSQTTVVGLFMKTYPCTDFDTIYTVYDEKIKVDYSTPENDYVRFCINEAKFLAEEKGEEEFANCDASKCRLKEAVTNKFENSYDNRVYTWEDDEESGSSVLIGDPDGRASLNQSRHMVVTGDYARNTNYVVTVEIAYDDHCWDNGVITKEATETEDGIRTYTCEGCRQEKTEIISKTNGDNIEIEKPAYKGDIIADGMIHQISEFYDFSTLPQGTVIAVEVDEQTQYINVPDELERLEVRLPIERTFKLVLPQGYTFKNTDGSNVMECTVRILDASASDDRKTETPVTPSNPKTGDDNIMLLWLMILTGSVAALTGTVLYGKKRNQK